MPLEVGQVVTVSRVFTQGDFDRFAALSGDDNPIHVDPDFASQTRFGRTVAHGMLLYSTICGVLHEKLPYARQLSQELTFPAPTYAGEVVDISVALEVIEPPGQSTFYCSITKQSGELVCTGRTRVVSGEAVRNVWPDLNRSPSSLEEDVTTGFKGLQVGQTASLSRTFSYQDLAEYVDLTGDSGRLVVDDMYARSTGLRGRVVPGGLLGGLFSCLLGTRLPGYGTNWLKQRLDFPSEAYPGEEVSATVEITRLRPQKDLTNLRTTCLVGERLVCRGEALVLVRDMR